jgi:hypothetical protein
LILPQFPYQVNSSWRRLEPARDSLRVRPAVGDDLGEATYAQMIHLSDEIIAGDNQHFRVVAFVRFGEEDESPFVVPP